MKNLISVLSLSSLLFVSNTLQALTVCNATGMSKHPSSFIIFYQMNTAVFMGGLGAQHKDTLASHNKSKNCKTYDTPHANTDFYYAFAAYEPSDTSGDRGLRLKIGAAENCTVTIVWKDDKYALETPPGDVCYLVK